LADPCDGAAGVFERSKGSARRLAGRAQDWSRFERDEGDISLRSFLFNHFLIYQRR